MMHKIKRALFSVDNLRDIEKFARALKKMQWHIIATAETVRRLKKSNIETEDIATFADVKEKYGFPPTLHSKIEAALTLDVPFRIDLVYDIPYSLDKGNDVGGHTLLGLGAKGGRIVVMSPEDMRVVIKELQKDGRHLRIRSDLHNQLLYKVNARISEHYINVCKQQKESPCDGWVGRAVMRLLNGENPYQVPSDLFISEDKDNLSLGKFYIYDRRLPCFTNLADVDCILHTMCLAAGSFYANFKKVPYIAIAAKHGNPCGMAIDWRSPRGTINKALFGNHTAIWGGEVITNFKIDKAIGQLLYESRERKRLCGYGHWMLDVIAAPDFDRAAYKLLSKSSQRKLLRNQYLYNPKLPSFPWHYRRVRGGFLRQPINNYILDLKEVHLSDRHKIKQNIDSLILAWSVAYSSNHGGNEIALVKDNKLLGVGGGPSTVDAANIAVLRAQSNRHDTEDSVFAADAFFPFTDAPEILVKAGCCSGVFPLGGKNERLINKYFRRNKVSMVRIPSQYRGFCRH